jgi:rhodanese-related sulfurtransferase
MRSASAKNILKSNGFTNVYNGGWLEYLQSKLQKIESQNRKAQHIVGLSFNNSIY